MKFRFLVAAMIAMALSFSVGCGKKDEKKDEPPTEETSAPVEEAPAESAPTEEEPPAEETTEEADPEGEGEAAPE